MKRTLGTLLGITLLFFTASLWAQKSRKKTTADKSTAKEEQNPVKKYKDYKTPIPVYLGHSDVSGGLVPKHVFDSLMKQGLLGRDSSNVEYKVTGFNFNYAERNLYEDSTGNLMVLSDYMMEYCNGDTVSANIAATLYQRTKEGDTVYIDQLSLMRPDNAGAMGRSFKIVIGK